MADPVNIAAQKLVDLVLSTIDALDIGSRVGMPEDTAHWSALNHIFGKTTAAGDDVSEKSDYNYKTDFETWREN